MKLEDVRFADMNDDDWAAFEKKMKDDREELKKKDSVAALDVYNEMVNTIYKAIRYKNVTDLLQYRFIDIYDISCLTGIPLKEIKCMQIFIEKSR